MLYRKDILSINDFTREDFENILQRAEYFEKKGYKKHRIENTIVGSLFFEASTRTRLSFETATHRTGGAVIGFSGIEGTSFEKKGESLEDTIRMVDGYADCIVIRHPDPGSAIRAAKVATHPVINAGDGTNEHPTQTLVDLFAIQKTQGKIDGIKIAMVGDLKYGRVPHSLAKALTKFNNITQYWIAPKILKMPNNIRKHVVASGTKVIEGESMEDIIQKVDILYMTRVQAERFKNIAEYERVKDIYILSEKILEEAKATARILHALPRRFEIPEEIDTNERAYYFKQAAGGPAVRAALLTYILNKE